MALGIIPVKYWLKRQHRNLLQEQSVYLCARQVLCPFDAAAGLSVITEVSSS